MENRSAKDLLIEAPHGASYVIYFYKKLSLELFHFFWNPEWQRVALVIDQRILDLYGDEVLPILRYFDEQVLLLPFPSGEHFKTRRTKEVLEDRMLKAHLGRDTVLVACGGGVALDLGGFIASTYMRGIPAFYIATSLLAQVDASVGGKTAVNSVYGKNLIGAFSFPTTVLMPYNMLSTLSHDDHLNGVAECIKIATLLDKSFFALWEEFDPHDKIPPEWIRLAVELKAWVISLDPFDIGFRRVLNFGHTVGHALEAALSPRLSHGFAVSIGMALESRYAVGVGHFSLRDQRRLILLLRRMGLPTEIPKGVCFQDLLPYLKVDKKNCQKKIKLICPNIIGEVDDNEDLLDVDEELFKALWCDDD